jgi:hypothetical protein
MTETTQEARASAKFCVMQDTFCGRCHTLLSVRGTDERFVIAPANLLNERSGCCNFFLQHVLRVVDPRDAFKAETYTSMSAPPSTAWSTSVEGDEIHAWARVEATETKPAVEPPTTEAPEVAP